MEASLWPLIDMEHVCEGTRQVNLELQIWGDEEDEARSLWWLT